MTSEKLGLRGGQPRSVSHGTRTRADSSIDHLIADGGGWTTVPGGKPLRLGAKGKRVARLRLRLEFTGDIDFAPQDRAIFDERLEKGVKHYQARHGMKQDGVVGRRVVIAMNVPASDRVR